MTKPLRNLIEVIAESLPIPKKVVEIGSRQAYNQSEIADMRPFFLNSKYIGVDMEAGAGVDMVVKGEKLPFKNSSVDLVLCLETFEHCDKFWEVAREASRICSKNGVVVISSQQNFPIHMHPSDYFRFTPFGLKSLFPDFKSTFVVSISPPFDDEVKLNPQHVIFVGKKSQDQKLIAKIKKNIKKKVDYISVHKPYRHRLQGAIALLKRATHELNFRQDVEFF